MNKLFRYGLVAVLFATNVTFVWCYTNQSFLLTSLITLVCVVSAKKILGK